MGYVDGSSLPPPQFISTNDETPEINLEYITWHRQDQLLLSWIISTLTEGVHAQVVGLSTSHDVWSHLAATYGGYSKAQFMQLRFQLLQMKKGSDKHGFSLFSLSLVFSFQHPSYGVITLVLHI